MSELSNLQLIELSGQFTQATGDKLQKDPATVAKIQSSVNEEEMKQLQGLAQKLAAGMMAAQMAVLSGQSEEEAFAELAPLALIMAEKTTEIALRVVDAADLADCVPAGARNEQTVAAFEANDAPNMARMFKPA